MPDAIELKPCPFCESTKVVVLPRTCNVSDDYDPADRAFPIVRCGGCYAEAMGETWGSPETAIVAWNRRATPQPDAIDQASYWKGAFDRMAARNVELSNLLSASPQPPARDATGGA